MHCVQTEFSSYAYRGQGLVSPTSAYACASRSMPVRNQNSAHSCVRRCAPGRERAERSHLFIEHSDRWRASIANSRCEQILPFAMPCGIARFEFVRRGLNHRRA